MAEWIKLQEKIIRDPVVMDQVEVLKIDPRIIAWSWVTLWDWARELTTTGFIARVTPARIDLIVNIPGFADSAGDWLIFRDGGVEFPNWDAHNSDGAKERALNARRTKKYRQNKGEKGDVTAERVARDGNTVSRDTVESVARHGQSSPEEKRREEKRNHQHHGADNAQDGGGGGGEEADARRKALTAAGINPGPVLDELTATSLRPSQIAMIAQEVRNRGGKGGVLVNALRDAASKPPAPQTAPAPAPKSPDPPVDPEAEKRALRATLETTKGERARRIIEQRLRELEGAA